MSMLEKSQRAEIVFYGPLRALLDKERVEVEASEGRSIRKVLLGLGIPAEQLLYTMALVNSKRVDLDYHQGVSCSHLFKTFLHVYERSKEVLKCRDITS
jgi:hypothetical protein